MKSLGYWQLRPYIIRPTCYSAVSGGESIIRLSLGKLCYWLTFCKWSNGLKYPLLVICPCAINNCCSTGRTNDQSIMNASSCGVVVIFCILGRFLGLTKFILEDQEYQSRVLVPWGGYYVDTITLFVIVLFIVEVFFCGGSGSLARWIPFAALRFHAVLILPYIWIRNGIVSPGEENKSPKQSNVVFDILGGSRGSGENRVVKRRVHHNIPLPDECYNNITGITSLMLLLVLMLLH